MSAGILWTLAGALMLGVFARTLLTFGLFSILFVGASAAACAVAYALRRERALLLCAIFLTAFAAGAARMHAAILAPAPALDALIGETAVLEGVVTDEPDVREDSVRIPLRVTTVGGAVMSDEISALVVAPLHTPVAYGDRLRAEGVLRIPEAFETGAGRVFDYPGYLAAQGILYYMPFAQITVLDHGGFFLKAWAIRLKQAYLRGIANALGEPQAGLAGGITVGDRRGLGTELSDTFRTVGLTHVIVLSGYNITVVIDALARALAFAPQIVRSSGSVAVAVFFAAITGFAAASVRAAIMAAIAVVGRATGRIYEASRALAAVAAGMVLWNPYIFVYDPGFQLSILATAGLIFIAPVIEPRLQRIPSRFGFREVAVASLSAQAAVLPLLLYENGQLSLFALPANLLALVVMPPAMLASALAAIAGLIAPIAAPVVGFPAYVLLSYVIEVARGFAALPFSALSVPPFGAWLLFTAYAALGCCLVAAHKKNAAGLVSRRG